MSDVLVDSSLWIDFFRGQPTVVSRLDSLLANDRVAVSGPIIAEVASGARSLKQFEWLRQHLSALNVLPDPPDLWQRVAEARFQLARKGVQAHLVDLSIAITATAYGHALATRDKDFRKIAKVLLLDLELV